jgi:hypothetical protein
MRNACITAKHISISIKNNLIQTILVEKVNIMGSYQTAITINDVLNNIHSRKYLIPAIQRKYVWTTEQIEAWI